MWSIFIFVIVWWLVLFAVLPFGVVTEDRVQGGNDPGAPKKTNLKAKLLITTFISLVITALVQYAIPHISQIIY